MQCRSALLNVGRIQYSAGAFNMYREGITEAVARVIRGVHGEVRAVADALGTTVLEYRDEDYRSKTSVMGVAFRAPFDTDAVIAKRHRPPLVHQPHLRQLFPLPPARDRPARVNIRQPHPLPLTSVSVDLEYVAEGIRIVATARVTGQTGVEMEALTAAAVAGLTVIDMTKGVERGVYLEKVRLLAKSGGRSGTWKRSD